MSNFNSSWLAMYQRVKSFQPVHIGRKWFWVLVLILVLLTMVSTAKRMQMVYTNMPYSLHFDETNVNGRALSILKSGDLNPHWFHKPSLPIYINVIGMTLGMFTSDGKVTHPRQIKSVWRPFYHPADIMLPSRLLICLLGSGMMLLAGALVCTTYREYLCLPFIPLVFSASNLIVEHSWRYYNVDTFTAFFSLATLSLLLWLLRSENKIGWSSIILLALLSGAAIASKYHHGLLLIPVLLATAFYPHKFPKWSATYYIMLSLIFFVIMTPYSILSITEFTNHLAREVAHYGRGHGHATAEPGWGAFLKYFESALEQFGWAGLVLFVVGLTYSFLREFKLTLICISLPSILLAYMCTQYTHFPRNILTTYCMVGLWISVGFSVVLVQLYRFMCWVLAKQIFSLVRPGFAVPVAWTVSVFIGIAGVSVLPWRSAEAEYTFVDSRVRLSQWANANLDHNASYIISRNAEFDHRSLQGDHEINLFRKVNEMRESFKADLPKPVYVILPEFKDAPLFRSYWNRLHQFDVRSVKRFGHTRVRDHRVAVTKSDPILHLFELLESR